MNLSQIIHPTVLISAFAVLWFLCFFCLLPIGLGDVDPVTGAPKSPRLKWKLLCATAIATLLFAVFYGFVHFGWITL